MCFVVMQMVEPCSSQCPSSGIIRNSDGLINKGERNTFMNMNMKKILLMVDVQNGFVKTEYAEQSFARICDLMKRELFDVVIATKYWNQEGSPLTRFMDWHDMMTEKEQALRPEIADYVDYILEKETYSAVSADLLRLLWKVNGGSFPECVFVLGYDTECCVLTTATDLFEGGIRPVLLSDYCGSHDGAHYHEAGLLSLDHLIGPDLMIDGSIRTAEDLNRILFRVMEKTS